MDPVNPDSESLRHMVSGEKVPTRGRQNLKVPTRVGTI
jgi:hypothetical protein